MEKSWAIMGRMVFYPKNGWHSMKNNMLKYKKISNFRLITVNGEHIFFSIKKFGFFFCKLHPSRKQRYEGGGVIQIQNLSIYIKATICPSLQCDYKTAKKNIEEEEALALGSFKFYN